MVKFTKNPFILIICLAFSLELQASNSTNFGEDDIIREGLCLKGIALFSSKDPFSRAIKVVTSSPFSHVGLIFSPDRDSEPEEWFCFESTGSASEVLHGIAPHVRLTHWNDVVKNYPGRITVRKLEANKLEEEEKPVITQFIKTHDQKKYEKNPLELIRSIMKWNKEPDESTVFCSELAAKCLMDLGYLEESPPNNYLPRDFSKMGGMTLNGGRLGSEEVFKEKPSKMKNPKKYHKRRKNVLSTRRGE